MANKKTSNHILAYFDILGYKDILKRSLFTEEELIGYIEEITQMVLLMKQPLFGKRRAKVYCFSDNFVICIKIDREKEIVFLLEALIFALQKIQTKLLAEYSIFIRGSIVKGKIYGNRNFIFGEGLIKAYEIENELAVYPRIIVEYDLVKEVIGLVKGYFEFKDIQPAELISERNFCYQFREALFDDDNSDDTFSIRTICLRRDVDNEFFVDFLQDLLNVIDDKVIRKIDCDNEIESLSDFNLILFVYYNIINKALSENAENKHVLIKYLWCCSYINLFCLENDIQPPFTYESIQDNTNINLKNAKYKELKEYLRMYSK